MKQHIGDRVHSMAIYRIYFCQSYRYDLHTRVCMDRNEKEELWY